MSLAANINKLTNVKAKLNSHRYFEYTLASFSTEHYIFLQTQQNLSSKFLVITFLEGFGIFILFFSYVTILGDFWQFWEFLWVLVYLGFTPDTSK